MTDIVIQAGLVIGSGSLFYRGVDVEGALSEQEESVTFRSLPHNDEAEQALLGALLVNNEKSHVVSAFLRDDHFFQPIHGRIFEAILKLVERGQIANPVTLKHYFENDDALTDIGGAQYLARLVGSTVTIINAQDYAARSTTSIFAASSSRWARTWSTRPTTTRSKPRPTSRLNSPNSSSSISPRRASRKVDSGRWAIP